MSPTRDNSGFGSGLPIWDGSSSDPPAWDNYRYTIQGYCDGKGLSALLRIKYDNSVKSEGGETPDGELQDKFMGQDPQRAQLTELFSGSSCRPREMWRGWSRGLEGPNYKVR